MHASVGTAVSLEKRICFPLKAVLEQAVGDYKSLRTTLLLLCSLFLICYVMNFSQIGTL